MPYGTLSGMSKRKRRGTKGLGTLVKPSGRTRTWGVRWTEEGIRKFLGGFTTMDQASTKLAEIAARVALKIPGLPVAERSEVPSTEGAKTLDDASTGFLAQRGPGTAVDSRNRWKRDLSPYLGKVQVEDLGNAELVGLVGSLQARGLSGASVERALHLLSAFYRWYSRTSPLSNPVKVYLDSLERSERNKLKTQHDSRDTPFIAERGKLVEVFRALAGPEQVAFALGAFAGLRPGEALALSWTDVNLGKGTLTVRQSVRHGKVGPTKGRKVRVIDMVPSLRGFLASIPQEGPTVVQAKRQGHLDDAALNEALAPVLVKLGLPTMTAYQCTRHTFASQWILAGQDIYRLAKVLGHSSVITTQRYAHGHAYQSRPSQCRHWQHYAFCMP